MNAHGITARRGVLDGDGLTPVFARVYTGVVPDIVPADLAAYLAPVRDETGMRTDWSFDPLRLLEKPAVPGSAPLARFRAWRSAYVQEAALGDLGTVRAFLTWAQARLEVGALLALDDPDVRIDPATATRVAAQSREAGRVCRAAGVDGLGISSAGVAGLVRGVVVDDDWTVVLTGGGAQLVADRSRLYVRCERRGPADPAADVVSLHAAARVSLVPVDAWAVTDAGVGVTSADLAAEGGVLDPGEPGGELLRRLVAPYRQAQAAPAPLTSVFSGIVTALPELAVLAARHATALHITTVTP